MDYRRVWDTLYTTGMAATGGPDWAIRWHLYFGVATAHTTDRPPRSMDTLAEGCV
jgi:hypothetical protein